MYKSIKIVRFLWQGDSYDLTLIYFIFEYKYKYKSCQPGADLYREKMSKKTTKNIHNIFTNLYK